MSTPQQSTFLADVVPVVGQDVAAELVRQLGGTTFPVPKRQSRQGELRYRMLAEVVGEEAADLLVYHYGGSDLYIPRALGPSRIAGTPRSTKPSCARSKPGGPVRRLSTNWRGSIS